MSLCRFAQPAVTSSATSLRNVINPVRRCAQPLRAFSSYGNAHQSSRRDMQTATAYQPHSLPTSFPPPRNSGIPDTSIAADAPPAPETSTQQKSGQSASSNVSVRENEAQQPKPTESTSTASKPAEKEKPRRKLRARKAAMKVTPLAIDQLRKLVAQPDPKMIRVGVKNRGCSGLAYHLEYVEKPGTFDEVVEQDGVKVYIDSRALFSIIGSEMDWQEDKLNQRFVFRNPNIKEQCGCGESFMV